MANSIDAYIPQLWAMESLMILEDNIVAANLVHRDFENMLQSFGDTVNTRQPATFTAKRKGVDDNVTDQNATATNVAVKLDQHVHVSFVIKDGEMSKSFKNLVEEFLRPAIIAQAKMLDQIVLGQYGAFLHNQVPGALTMTSTNAKARILAARGLMNVNKVPESGRNFIWTPNSETQALNTDLFIGADSQADGGLAMREAVLGRKLGFTHYMSQLAGAPTVSACDLTTGAINNASGYNIGDTSLVVDGFTGDVVPANSFIVIDGGVYRVASSSLTTGNTTGIVLQSGLKAAVADNAVIKAVGPGAVNLVAGYAQYYSGAIAFDAVTNTPVVGQNVSFGTTAGSAVYTIVEMPTSSTMVLDRPLEAAVADNAILNLGAYGDFNFAFHRNAIALVVRPLALPPTNMASSAVVNNNGLSMRVTMTYDGLAQGTRITLDMLCGVKVLNTSLGCVIMG